MKYDFDAVYDRTKSDCAKWGAVKAIFGREDIIPM
jgi:cystathionine beta-lyase